MSEKMTLAQCPIGLFLSSYGNLCLKTEYGDNEGRIDAYIVDSGEFFWGEPPQTIESQRAQIVEPFDFAAALRAAVEAERAALDALFEKLVGPYCDQANIIAIRLSNDWYDDILRALEPPA